ncbi:MAG: hypothetical protein HC786_03275 [Richelia sp. CSU_2_1]|nr:hypothetical protein [Microcoleus sp. SU_5_6]NJL68020.1 hypothetical protein [Microcoleus sp. SM1_3_4]NJR21258.1 hypothetical protein [Richelia sp. CSU_2_1]
MLHPYSYIKQLYITANLNGISTVNCQLSTVNYQRSTVNCQLSTVNYF